MRGKKCAEQKRKTRVFFFCVKQKKKKKSPSSSSFRCAQKVPIEFVRRFFKNQAKIDRDPSTKKHTSTPSPPLTFFPQKTGPLFFFWVVVVGCGSGGGATCCCASLSALEMSSSSSSRRRKQETARKYALFVRLPEILVIVFLFLKPENDAPPKVREDFFSWIRVFFFFFSS